MKYSVIVTPEAEANIVAAFNYIHDRAPLNARRWLVGLYKSIDSLEMFPSRCGAARESRYAGERLRQFIYKSHRIIFRIEEAERIVRILHVRHSAQDTIGGSSEPRDK